ncbi:MAG: Lin1244/Lin1753 domain-containing protein [Flavobacteriales bacterium AspAUS03]
MCGANSISVLLYLLCNIYREQRYYIGWHEKLVLIFLIN